MAQESIVLTVLPLTVQAGAHHHLSLHVAPRLTPDGGEGVLDSFARLREWGQAALAATWAVELPGGARLAATPLLDAVDADLWDRVFPPDTPVRGPKFETFQGRDLRSFDARQAHDLAVAATLYGALLFPLDPPLLSSFIGHRESPIELAIRRIEDDAATTKLLDAGGGDALGPLGPILQILHPVRRFYERRELARPPQPRPTPGAAPVPLPTPKPDFHERVAHLADQPALLRRLGLVIDLKVDDLAALAAAAQLRAVAPIEGLAVIRPITPVTHAGDLLLTKPRGDDWQSGCLALGDGKRFSTLTLDTDGAALKLEAFVRSLPKMLAVTYNNDPGNAAPPAQRAEGLAVVRRGKANDVRKQLDAAQAMLNNPDPERHPPVLATEDVTRGFRVEVWDDHVGKWFSLHARLATARLADAPDPPIYADQPEFGAIQTSAAQESPGVVNSPVYIHESLFGWSGWSLSAPRPGPRAVFSEGKEEVTEEQPDPISPVVITTRVAPNTLPRLRYGRSYAFRAWSVDMAGNSPGAAPLHGTTAPKLADRLPQLSVLASAITATLGSTGPSTANLHAADLGTGEGAYRLTGDAQLDALAVRRLRATASIPSAAASRASLTLATRSVIADATLVPPAGDRHAALIKLLRADRSAHVALNDALKIANQTITPLTPFLRWDPVPPPAVVARHRFSLAESIRHVVIRSGVDIGADGQPVVIEPAPYIAAVQAQDPALAQDWRDQSERHLAAPKGSQHLNELHGRFDAAIGHPEVAATLLGAAFRDDGTLYDTEIADLGDPEATIAQPGMSLEAEPGVAPVDLSAVTGANRGNAIPPGHYVVHDVDQLRLPYLPDPMARGVGFDMVGANVGSPLVGLYRVESTSVDFSGAWPEPRPLRLVLESASQVVARVDGDVVHVGLPPGSRLDINLSSTIARKDLGLFALWNLIPASLRTLDLLERPAADGQFWALTPQESISLVHAVPRPILPPLISVLNPIRPPGDTGAHLIAFVDAHAGSTGRIDCEASWTEPVDDPSTDGPTTEERNAIACHAEIGPEEDLVMFGLGSTTVDVPGVGKVPVHKGRHEFGDTKHRLISYTMRGSTRFREYFPEPLVDTVDKRSLVSAPKVVHVLSSAPPPLLLINSVLPLFRWDEAGDPGQPFGLRRRRRAGLRLYLERPWFQTGDDEQLAVLFPGADTATGHLSSWGADPIWLNQGPPNQLVGLAVEDVYTSVGLDGVRGPDPRLSPPVPLPVADAQAGPGASLLAYRPEYNPDRRLWFVDVAIEPAAAVWPFVRLAVARYQPYALPGLQLSRIEHADFIPLPPERTLTISRPDRSSVRITVSGPIGLRQSLLAQGPDPHPPVEDHSAAYPLGKADFTNVVAQDRRVFAILEHRAKGLVTDLGWREIVRRELSIGGLSSAAQWAWTGVIDLPDPLTLDTPGLEGEWRVAVEEHEAIESDPEDPNTDRPLTKEWRIVYADAVVI
jgi:hypothetical protein